MLALLYTLSRPSSNSQNPNSNLVPALLFSLLFATPTTTKEITQTSLSICKGQSWCLRETTISSIGIFVGEFPSLQNLLGVGLRFCRLSPRIWMLRASYGTQLLESSGFGVKILPSRKLL